MPRRAVTDPIVRDLARTKTHRGRIWLHLRCILRAIAGILREVWPR